MRIELLYHQCWELSSRRWSWSWNRDWEWDRGRNGSRGRVWLLLVLLWLGDLMMMMMIVRGASMIHCRWWVWQNWTRMRRVYHVWALYWIGYRWMSGLRVGCLKQEGDQIRPMRDFVFKVVKNNKEYVQKMNCHRHRRHLCAPWPGSFSPRQKTNCYKWIPKIQKGREKKTKLIPERKCLVSVFA